MGEIKIQLNSLITTEEQANKICSKLDSVQEGVSRLRSVLDSEILSRNNINSRLNSSIEKLTNVSTQITNIKNTVQSGIAYYNKTENQIIKLKDEIIGGAASPTYSESLNYWQNVFENVSTKIDELSTKAEQVKDDFISNVHNVKDTIVSGANVVNAAYIDLLTSVGGLFLKAQTKEDSKNGISQKAGLSKTKIKEWDPSNDKNYVFEKDFDKKGYTPSEKKDKSFKDKALDNIVLYDISKKEKSSLISDGDSDVSGIYEYGYSYDVLKAEEKQSIYVGKGGVGVTYGMAVSAFEIEGKNRLGNEYAGVELNGEIVAGKLETKVEGKIGIVDSDGKIDPNLSVKGSAEAMALEANLEVVADLPGVDVTGEAGVTVGIGGHVNVGYDDGVLKVDVGAAVGLGVSVDLEIDISETLDVAVEHAKGIYNFATDVVTTTMDVVDASVDTVVDLAGGVYEVGKDAVCWLYSLVA